MNPDPSSSRISLRDIAKQLGVSHSTVSLALRDHPRISETVRHKIKEAAEQMGYQPDPMLAALAHYRRGKVEKQITAELAWINAWPNAADLRSLREFDFYWKGAYAAAAKFGYRLEEFRLGGQFTPQRLHQILSARGIRGLMLPPHHHQPEWGDFPWEQYSVMRFGRSLITPEVHVVTADQVANTLLAVRKMTERGYQRIGFVGDENLAFNHGVLFEAGFLLAQRRIPEPNRVPPFDICAHASRSLQSAFNAWLKEHRPDAIFTPEPVTVDLLAKAGLKVPDDIGLAVTSVLDARADAGIDQHPEEIGRVGFLMLNSLLNDGAKGLPTIFRQLLVEGAWVDGKSLPPKS